jgi:hypothetical protein
VLEMLAVNILFLLPVLNFQSCFGIRKRERNQNRCVWFLNEKQQKPKIIMKQN